MAGRWHYPQRAPAEWQPGRSDFGCLITIGIFVATWALIIFGIVRAFG